MNWTYNTIWTEQLPHGEFHNITCDNSKSSLNDPIHGTYFIVRGFKPKDRCFENYPAISTATYFELNCSNIHHFRGISKLGKIKRIETSNCLKLNSDEGLAELKEEIEWLHVNQSRKFSIGDDLLSLKNLKVLCLNSCAPLDNLEFLYEFPELVDFRFVDTNVLDGDLKPLIEHPSLLSAGFLNKRHYNLKEKEVDEHFEKKSASAHEWIYKGEYRTFRYNVFA